MTEKTVNQIQLGRVIAIMCDGKFRTLRDIGRESWNRFGASDCDEDIKSCLQAAHAYGYRRQDKIQPAASGAIWFYSLQKLNGGLQL